MANKLCPNCGEHKFKKEASARTGGFWLMVAGFAGPAVLGGASQGLGGFMEMPLLIVIIFGLLFLLGVFLFAGSFLPGTKQDSYYCSNCNHRATYGPK